MIRNQDEIYTFPKTFILDLEGKKVAGLAGSLNFPIDLKASKNSPQNLASKQFIGKNSYIEVLEALQNGEVDAGVTNKDYGEKLNDQNYHIARTRSSSDTQESNSHSQTLNLPRIWLRDH